jgi:hypothetical protein
MHNAFENPGGKMKEIKVKIFNYFSMNINPPNEMQINEWLAQHPDIEIVHISQSESMVNRDNRIERNMSVTILYRDESPRH